jgi:ribosomal protein L21E
MSLRASMMRETTMKLITRHAGMQRENLISKRGSEYRKEGEQVHLWMTRSTQKTMTLQDK